MKLKHDKLLSHFASNVKVRPCRWEAVEASAHAAPYESAPPTPYLAYLRQGNGKEVHNHVIYALGFLDKVSGAFVACSCRLGGGVCIVMLAACDVSMTQVAAASPVIISAPEHSRRRRWVL